MKKMAKTIGLISLKGGVGKTTLSAALASHLANAHDKKVLLVDANYSAPNLGLHMDIISPEGSVHEVLSGGNISSAVHHRYGVDVIPGSFLYSKDINPLKLKNRLAAVKQKYDFIVLDSSPSLNEEVLSTMLASDHLFVVTTPDYATLSCSMKAAKLAKQRNTPISGIIINRISDPLYEVSMEEIQECTDIPVVARVKEDKHAKRALFRRVPATLDKPNSRFSREIDKFSKALVGQEEAKWFGTKWWGSFKKEQVNREVLREGFIREGSSKVMSDDCVFCRIVKEEIPCHKIYEDDKCIVILDKFPNTKGQSLVISKVHVPYVLDLEDGVYSDMFLTAKKVAKAVDASLDSERTCIVVEGFDVPHVHVKVFPTYGDGLKLNMGGEANDKDLEKLATAIRGSISDI
jgi:histidine triad (HIT) family protein